MLKVKGIYQIQDSIIDLFQIFLGKISKWKICINNVIYSIKSSPIYSYKENDTGEELKESEIGLNQLSLNEE